MNFLYFLGWGFFRVSFTVWFRWRTYNPERVPQKGAMILACNHASILDPPVAGAGLNRAISYLARESLFSFPPIGWLFHKWHAVPVDRDGSGAKGVRTILERLQMGEGIILFPEGTRTKDGSLQPARSGIGLLVIKSGAPVVPVRTFGTFAALGRGKNFPRPCHVSVKYGMPMHFEKLRAEAENCSKERLKAIYQEIADEIMAAIAKLEPKKD